MVIDVPGKRKVGWMASIKHDLTEKELSSEKSATRKWEKAWKKKKLCAKPRNSRVTALN